MKKLMLVPILALSLLTGCNSNTVETITIDKWLEHYDDPTQCNGYYTPYTSDFERVLNPSTDDWDYDNYVLSAIKKGAEKSTRKSKRPKEELGDILIFYLLSSKQEYNIDGCFIYVFENYMMTFTDFIYQGEVKSQRCYYEYDTSVGKEIINTTLNRAQEIKDTAAAEKKYAEQEATIERFIAKAEIATNASITFDDSTNVKDENLSFLNTLKTIDFDDDELVSRHDYARGDRPIAIYNLDEHYSLRIGDMNSYTSIHGVDMYPVTACYHYRPKFIKDVYYEEGKYGVRTKYLINEESFNKLKAVLDSLKTA